MNHLTQDVLIDYLHGELPPGDDAMVLLHLEGCSACRHEYDIQADLTEAIRAYARATEAELPDDVRRSIWSAIDVAEAASLRGRLRRWIAPLAGVAAAAAAAIAIVVLTGPQHAAGPAIDAIYYLDDHAALTSTVPFNEGSVVPSSLVTGTTTSDQQWLSSSGADDVADVTGQR
jgi:predicted anti-sigma-YlaC factor YlaD